MSSASPPGTAPRRAWSGRWVFAAVVAIVVILFGFGVALPSLACRSEHHAVGTAPKLDDFGVVPHFALTDQRGNAFTEADLAGHWTIVNFIFTRCDTICPASSMKMQHLQDETKAVGGRVKLVSFSVDPAFDTPARLAEYGKRFAEDAARWSFVTGPEADMKALLEKTFMTSMTNNGVTASGAPDIAHGGHFLLLDAELHIRALYDVSVPEQLTQLASDARYLGEQPK